MLIIIPLVTCDFLVLLDVKVGLSGTDTCGLELLCVDVLVELLVNCPAVELPV